MAWATRPAVGAQGDQRAEEEGARRRLRDAGMEPKVANDERGGGFACRSISGQEELEGRPRRKFGRREASAGGHSRTAGGQHNLGRARLAQDQPGKIRFTGAERVAGVVGPIELHRAADRQSTARGALVGERIDARGLGGRLVGPGQHQFRIGVGEVNAAEPGWAIGPEAGRKVPGEIGRAIGLRGAQVQQQAEQERAALPERSHPRRPRCLAECCLHVWLIN